MKKFNINDCIYIQITEPGWKHLMKTVGKDYIKHCIKIPAYEKVINDEKWYRLQVHNVFELFPITGSNVMLFKTTVMIDDETLKPI